MSPPIGSLVVFPSLDRMKRFFARAIIPLRAYAVNSVPKAAARPKDPPESSEVAHGVHGMRSRSLC